jgi:7-cyano-7-deazaguanine tRNA-ribosyltransferase
MMMQVVAGLSVKNLHPRVWDPSSRYYIPSLSAVMVSYADFHQMPARMRKAKKLGLHAYLGVGEDVQVFLDNGAFYFLRNAGQAESRKYRDFRRAAEPDWYPIPFDAIPTPCMSARAQRRCFDVTMDINVRYQRNGYVPVIHISGLLKEYIARIRAHANLSKKERIALGGIVPNLLRAPKALPFEEIIASVRDVRRLFAKKEMHVFGIGGTATLHVAALLGVDSVDSSGWRNRAARGIIQMPGSGDRMIADLGKWRGRRPSEEELVRLAKCRCPACQREGIEGLKREGIEGFCCRATHNLWILLEEARWIDKHLRNGSYKQNYRRRLDNSTYLPLIKKLLAEPENCAMRPKASGAAKCLDASSRRRARR